MIKKTWEKLKSRYGRINDNSKDLFILKGSEQFPTDLNVSYEFVNQLEKIRAYLKKYLNMEAVAHQYRYLEEDCNTVLFRDMSNGDVRMLTRITDAVPMSWEKDSKSGDPKLRTFNQLFYYEKFNVAVVNMVYYITNGRPDAEIFIFAEHEDDLVKYFDYVMENSNKRQSNEIFMIVDTRNGQHLTTEEVSDLVNREHVFLDDYMKDQIYMGIDRFFQDGGEFYKKYNIPYRRGILLYGKPGNGKTTLIKSLISDLKIPISYWQVTEYTDSDSIINVFDSLKDKREPQMLIIEDMDSLPKHARSTFLNLLDGVTTNDGIFIIGTTNFPEQIDPALMNRSGRFDMAYEIKPPTAITRRKFLESKNILDLISNEDLEHIVTRTEGLSMAILNEVYTECVFYIHHNDGKVDVEKIVDQIAKLSEMQKTGEYFKSDRPSVVGFGMVEAR